MVTLPEPKFAVPPTPVAYALTHDEPLARVLIEDVCLMLGHDPQMVLDIRITPDVVEVFTQMRGAETAAQRARSVTRHRHRVL